MENETTGQPAPDAASDGDFVIESNSVPFELPPADTTAQAAPAPPPSAVAQTDTVEDRQSVADEEVDEASASQATAQQPAGRDPKTGQFSKQPAGKAAKKKARYEELEWQAAERQRQLDAERKRIADLERQLAEARTGAPPAAPAAPAQPTAQTPPKDALPERPQHPSYRDFATDEEYDAATKKWREDDAKWLADREKALKDDITKGLDTRIKSERAYAEAAEDLKRFGDRIDKARAAHADWDEKKETLKDLRSSWYDPQKHQGPTPFVTDIARHHEEGGEFLYWLASDPDRAHAVAELFPTRPLRDALVHAPSVIPLLEHFATPEGRGEFEAMKRMQPAAVFMAVGALSARLTAPSGSVTPAAHPITSAVPPARPPVGAPGVTRGAAQPAAQEPWEVWMQKEDERELAERKKLYGVA